MWVSQMMPACHCFAAPRQGSGVLTPFLLKSLMLWPVVMTLRGYMQAYLKLSRTASTEESMRLLDSIGTDGGKPSWASAQGYHPDDGDEFGHLVDEIEDEEL